MSLVFFCVGAATVALVISTSAGALDSHKEHKTPGAIMQKNELSCYVCDTLEEGDKCRDLSIANRTVLLKKCQGDKRQCMVKRYSYTIGTENSTSVMRIWSIQRNCTSKCEPGCIIIGERTKLYSCESCCSQSGCNDSMNFASRFNSLKLILFLSTLVTPLNLFINLT